MPIALTVPGDPAGCRECANRLEAVANRVVEHADAFRDAGRTSEPEWAGTAGDRFRDRLAEMDRGTNQVGDSARAAATAIRAFADNLETAVNRMRHAAQIAAAAGLRVQSDSGAPTLIEDPDPIAAGVGDIAAEAVRSGDPYWETTAAKAATTFQPAADDAARVVAQNSRLLLGATDNGVVKALSMPVMQGGASTISKVGSKIPAAGVVLTGIQTFSDVTNAEDRGDAALAVAKNTGGFVAGTAATALILASVAGGPATLAAVGVGALVSWGTGFAIQKIWGD